MTHAHDPRACQQNNILILARLPGMHKPAQRPRQPLDCLSPFPKARRANSLASACETKHHCALPRRHSKPRARASKLWGVRKAHLEAPREPRLVPM